MMKKIFALLLAVLALLFAGCDGRDGNTSGSAESNGMISDDSRDHTSRRPDTSKEESKDLGDHVSDLISDVESGAEDLVYDAASAVSDLVDGQ